MKKIILVFSLVFSFSWILAQTAGGPDAYGYTWKNSNHTVSPPAYNWVDITSRGSEVAGLADDNVVGPYPLPAGFQFYWYPITQFWIGSNGYISFNGANIASPFPGNIPNSGGANDFVAIHLSDLNFSGANNPAQCFYYATNDSLIISYINVPYWEVTNGYTGSNSFQVIFTSADKHIHMNFKNMQAGSATTPIDCATGIENNTGALGLQTLIDVVPPNLSAIKYYYPSNVTYAVKDGGINWNNNEANGGYFIRVSNTPYTLKSNVKNFGNQPLTSFTVTDSIYTGNTALSNGTATVNGLQPGEDTTITFSNTFFAQFAATFRFSSRVQGITGDLVAANNRKQQKIIAVNTSLASYILDYSDGAPDGAGLSWNGGNGGIGVYIEPPRYPAQIDGAQFYISANGTTPVGFSAMVYDDNGTNGGPGTLLDSIYVPPGNINVGSYNQVTWQNTPIWVTQGGVYLVWYMGGDGIQIGRDLTPPASARSYEILGNAWAAYRSKLTEDFLMGLVVSNAPLPVANFSIDSSMAPVINFTDQSGNTPTSWHWDFGYNNDTSNVQNPSYTYPVNGNYTVCLKVANQYGQDSICKQLTIKNINIDEFALDYQPNVYPNPVTGRAFIDLPANVSPNNLVLQISTVTGQLVQIPYAVNGKRFEFETTHLSSGMYLFDVILKDQNRSLARGKFSIQ